MANTDMGRLEVKAQLTQQRKPTWLVECNCPTCRSWQSDKSCYSGPKENLIEDRRRRRKWPTKKSEGKLHQTKSWERRDQLGGTTKSRVPTKRRQRQASKAPIKEHQSNQWNGANHMQYQSNQTQPRRKRHQIKPRSNPTRVVPYPQKANKRKTRRQIKSKH